MAPAEFSVTFVFVRLTLAGASLAPFIVKVRFWDAVLLVPSDNPTENTSFTLSPVPKD